MPSLYTTAGSKVFANYKINKELRLNRIMEQYHHLNCQFNYWNQSVLAERAILVRLMGYCFSCETFTLPLLICSTVYCLWFIAEVCNQMAKKLAIVFFQLHSTSINCLHLWLQQKIVDESAVQDAITGGAWNKANSAQYGIVSYCGNVPH